MNNQEVMLALMARREHGTSVPYQAMAIAAHENLQKFKEQGQSVDEAAEFILQSAYAGAMPTE